MHTVVFGWFGGSAVWFIPLFWRLVKAALPGGAGLRGPGTIRLWLGFVCVMVASSTLEASLLNLAGENALGHALASGFGHLLGHVGTPLVALALFLVSLPWLIDFRWRDFFAWADGTFGLGLSRSLAKRDEDARRHRSVDDGLPQHVSPSTNTMAPRSNGRYARPTVWRPPSGGRSGASPSSASAGLNTATGSGYAPPARGAGWRAGTERDRRPVTHTEPVLRTGSIAPGRAAPLQTASASRTTNFGAKASTNLGANIGADRGTDKAGWLPTEPVAPAGWLRDASARGVTATASSAAARAASASASVGRVAGRPETLSGAAPNSIGAPGRVGASQAGRRTAGEQRQTGSLAGPGGVMAGAAGAAGFSGAAGAAGTAGFSSAAAASGLSGAATAATTATAAASAHGGAAAASAAAGMGGRPSASGVYASSMNTAGATPGVGRAAAVQRPSGQASIAGQAASAKQPFSRTQRADQTAAQSSAQLTRRAPTPAPTYTRPMATTQKVTPPASVQETLRSIAENAARWTDIAGVSLARSSNANGALDAVKMTPPPESGPAASSQADVTQHFAADPVGILPSESTVAQAAPRSTIAAERAQSPTANAPAAQDVFTDIDTNAPVAHEDNAVTTDAYSTAQAAPDSDDVPVVQWPLEPPVFHPPLSHPSVSHPSVSHPSVSHLPVSHPSVSHLPVLHPSVSHPPLSHLPVSHLPVNPAVNPAAATTTPVPGSDQPVKPVAATTPDDNEREHLIPVARENDIAAPTPANQAVATPAPVEAPVQTWASPTPTAAPAAPATPLPTSNPPQHAIRAATPTPFQIFAAQLESGEDADLSTLEDEAQTSPPSVDVTSDPQAVTNGDAHVHELAHEPPQYADATSAETKLAPWEDASAVTASPTSAPAKNAAPSADVGQNTAHSPAPANAVEPTPAPQPQPATPTGEQAQPLAAPIAAPIAAPTAAPIAPPTAAPIAEAQPASNVVHFPHFAPQVAKAVSTPADAVDQHNATAAVPQPQPQRQTEPHSDAAQATLATPETPITTAPDLTASNGAHTDTTDGTSDHTAAEPAPRAPLRGHGLASGFEFHAPAASMVELPTLDLLARADTDVEPVSEESLIETGLLIEQRLQEFKVPVTVVGHSAGPVITRFEVEPALGVRGSQIVGLMKDLSRGLGLTSIRVVETIPGKTCMGLELPNAKRQTIRLSEIIEADVYQHSHSQLTLAMGKDITGHPVVADLAKAPHMLVAGTTGSGKSVAINAMICSLLYKATPEEVRLIMIDPKMLELSVYEGIPHLLAPVVTDMKLAANALNWCVGEMEKRYRLMSAVGVRNLAGFNQKIRDAEAKGKKLGNPFSLTPEAPEPLAPLPLIVVVIDELADLMMVAGKKIEELIARLAQKARAAGIHLILATQRPSVDVITGLIKANIPTRVAFQVSSKIDSRTILDQMGAESLLGQGDMLFLPPGTGYPQRVHGAFVADEEVHAIVEYLKQFGEPQYEEGILDGPATEGAAPDLFGESPDAEADPLYDEAMAFVVRTRRASISSVQRQLRIGYNRAARLVEQMETAGLVSAMGINGSREVLAPGPAE